jgi:hypothetical protein
MSVTSVRFVAESDAVAVAPPQPKTPPLLPPPVAVQTITKARSLSTVQRSSFVSVTPSYVGEISIVTQPSAIVVAAPYAPAGPIIAGTSSSSVQIIEAPRQFTMNETGLGFAPGMRVRAAFVDDPIDQWMEGVVTLYNETARLLSVDVDLISGDGTYSDWSINVTGEPGQDGAQGEPGPIGPSGTGGIPEAPNDGVAYGRRTLNWTPVLMVSGDIMDGGNFITREGVF